MQLYPTNFCKTPSSLVSNHKPNFSAIRPVVPRYEKGGISALAQMRTDVCTPPMTSVICIVAWSLNTHKILSLSACPFLSYSLAANFYTPSLCSCHVPQWLPRRMGVGSIHGKKDVATHQRRLFQSNLWLQRYKLVKSVTASCRVGPGRSYLDFSTKPRRIRSALRPPLVISKRSHASIENFQRVDEDVDLKFSLEVKCPVKVKSRVKAVNFYLISCQDRTRHSRETKLPKCF